MRKQEQHWKQVVIREAPPRLGPLSYCAYAVEYLEAARAASTKGSRFKPAQTYLTCHAIELAPIAYLSSRTSAHGQAPYSLRPRDLWNLLEQAELNGLVRMERPTPAQRRQIKKATRYYSDAVFEFPALAEAVRGHPEAPDIRTLLRAASVLVAAARRAARADPPRTRKRVPKR